MPDFRRPPHAASTLAAALFSSAVIAATPAARQAARTPPDGYSLLATFAKHTTNLAVMKGPGYDLEREFGPVSQTIVFPNNLLASHPSLPAKDVKSLIALARKRSPVSFRVRSRPSVEHPAD